MSASELEHDFDELHDYQTSAEANAQFCVVLVVVMLIMVVGLHLFYCWMYNRMKGGSFQLGNFDNPPPGLVEGSSVVRRNGMTLNRTGYRRPRLFTRGEELTPEKMFIIAPPPEFAMSPKIQASQGAICKSLTEDEILAVRKFVLTYGYGEETPELQNWKGETAQDGGGTVVNLDGVASKAPVHQGQTAGGPPDSFMG